MGILLAFHQTYQPVGNVLLSALVAGLPLYVLFIMLAVLRLPAWICAVAAMLTAFVLSWLVWGMPFGVTVATATEGMAFGLWPISWIVLNAVFFHNLTVASGDFDVIKRALTRLTTDRRLQALLIAFSFGALLEGIAGFGAPVAITASILASLGFEPVTAAVLALLANTAPVAFGSIGIPVVTLGALVAPILHKDVTSTTLALSAMVGRQLPIFSIMIPGYLIVVLAGWRRMREILPAVLVTGISFAIVQFLVSNYVGPELTDIVAALVSMGCLALLLRFWRPAHVYRFETEVAAAGPRRGDRRVGTAPKRRCRGGQPRARPARVLDVCDLDRRHPGRPDGQPALLLRPPGRRRQDSAGRAGQHHRRPQVRYPRLQALPAAVDRPRSGQGPAGVQVPRLELLLARHLRDRGRQAGLIDLPREADRLDIL
jgi:L-lactate permease